MIAIVVSTLAATVMLADPPTTPAPAASPTPVAGRDRIHCEYIIPTGGRIPKKTCYSPREWENANAGNRQRTLEMLNRPINNNLRGD